MATRPYPKCMGMSKSRKLRKAQDSKLPRDKRAVQERRGVPGVCAVACEVGAHGT